jgi:hypothetical protein
VGARKLKGLNMIVNISYGYLYLREIELMLNTVYYFETVHFKHKYLLKHVRVETVTTGLTTVTIGKINFHVKTIIIVNIYKIVLSL